MLTLFLCIAIGFALRRTNVLPESSGKAMAKLENWVFCPALSFMTMARYCTVEKLSVHAVNVLLSICALSIALIMAIPLTKMFVKKKSSERGVYAYALTFGNFGYLGDSLIQGLFGDEMLSYYKLFTLSFSILVYTWGISVLVPSGEQKDNPLKKILNAPTVALLLGMIVGLTGTTAYIPNFITGTLDSLKACMGPVAMLLAGFTVAGYNIKDMLSNKKVYIATALRLVILPAVIISSLFGIKELINLVFALNINNTVLFLAFFAVAAPLGLNTIVFPEAYGGNPKTGAGMAMISHTLSVISIPLLYALMVVIFGTPVL